MRWPALRASTTCAVLPDRPSGGAAHEALQSFGMVDSSITSPAVLTKALLRAAEQLGLTADLPALLHISSAECSALQSGARTLDPQREEWKNAQKIVGLFRTLVTLLGALERARAWLSSPNDALGDCPLELLRGADAARVYRYLEAVQKHELRMPPRSKQAH